MANEPEARIEQALIDWFRRATDPRGNADLKARSGVDLERAASTLLARVGEHEPARLSDIAAATGVDVYQVTLPSRLAATSSTGSGLNSCLTSCADAAPTQRLAISAIQIRIMASSQQVFRQP